MDTQESTIQTETVDRKDLLAQQLGEVESEAAPVTTDAPAETRERGPDGKFLPKAAAAAAEAPEAAQQVEEPVWKRPPSSWKREQHEVWQTADPRLQEYAWQREEEMRAGVEPLLAKAKFADAMQKVMAPYEQTIRGLGIEPSAAVEALMRADHSLRTLPVEEKKAYFANLARQYGINLAEVQPSEGQAPVDPRLYQLEQELTNVRGQVVGWQQQQEEAQNRALNAEIDAFAKTAEHFEDVRPVMISLLQSGVAGNLKEAYEKAIRLDENLFGEIQKGRQAQDEVARRQEADKAAKAAKAAAVSVKSSTPGAPTQTKAQDRRSMIADQLDGLSERV